MNGRTATPRPTPTACSSPRCCPCRTPYTPPRRSTASPQLGCRVALIRPNDAMGNYPLQPKYEPVWKALEDTGLIYGMHPFPAGGALKPPGYTEQHSGAELVRRTVASSGVPHSFLSNVQNFQAEAALWVTSVLMSGFFERHPKINAAVFEASSTWLSFLLDECDKAARLYKNERQLPPLERPPSETFFRALHDGLRRRRGAAAAVPGVLWRHPDLVVRRLPPRRRRCLAGHADDAEVRPARRPIRPSSWAPTRGGCTTSRRLAISSASASPQIERPDWWPTEEEIQASLAADASVTLEIALMTQALRGVRRRLPRRGAARAVGKIPRAGISHPRPPRAVAAGGRHHLLPQGQRRDVPRHDESQPAAARAVAAGHDLGRDRRARPDGTASR